MKIKQFAVKSPEQLREMAGLVKSGGIERTAAMWSADRRRKGSSAWDGRIYVLFESQMQSRTAAVLREGTDKKTTRAAYLKYREALSWCKENLQMIRNTER